MRYFGTKEKLFAAAAEFDRRLPDLAAVPRDAIGSLLVGHFLDRWESDDTLQALLRAAVSHQVAVARLRAIFATQVMPALAPLWQDRATAATRVGLVATQSEEHTSELQSRPHLVCRLLLVKQRECALAR